MVGEPGGRETEGEGKTKMAGEVDRQAEPRFLASPTQTQAPAAVCVASRALVNT